MFIYSQVIYNLDLQHFQGVAPNQVPPGYAPTPLAYRPNQGYRYPQYYRGYQGYVPYRMVRLPYQGYGTPQRYLQAQGQALITQKNDTESAKFHPPVTVGLLSKVKKAAKFIGSVIKRVPKVPIL